MLQAPTPSTGRSLFPAVYSHYNDFHRQLLLFIIKKLQIVVQVIFTPIIYLQAKRMSQLRNTYTPPSSYNCSFTEYRLLMISLQMQSDKRHMEAGTITPLNKVPVEVV